MTIKSQLIKLKEGTAIHDAVWTYDLCAFKQLEQHVWCKFEKVLHNLLDSLITFNGYIDRDFLQQKFSETVGLIENLLQQKPLDEHGIYEYGGLNEFFADIMQTVGFEVQKGQHALIDDLVYNTNYFY